MPSRFLFRLTINAGAMLSLSACSKDVGEGATAVVAVQDTGVPAADTGADGGVVVSTPENGRSATGLVAGSVTSKSANYKLVGLLTSGQSTAQAASAAHRLNGGLVGATQSK